MMKPAPIITAAAVRKIGLNQIAPCIEQSLAQHSAFCAPVANDEIDKQDRVAHDDPG